MKKTFTWFGLMSLVTFLLVLTACGGSTESGSSQQEEGDTSTETTDEAPATDDGQTYSIKLPTVVNADNFVAIGFQKFKELVEEKSDGRIDVEIYLGGTLSSSDEENFQLLREGTAQVIGQGPFIPAQIAGIDGYNIYDFPFLFEDRDQLFEFMEGPVGEEMRIELEESTGAKILGYYDIGSLSILNSSHPITEPGDLNGLNIRTPQASVLMDTISVMGGNPTPITFAEVYTSLQQGTIDGLTTTVPLMYDAQFYEVSEYLTLTQHVLFPYILFINNDFFESLPADLQDVVLEAADEMIQFARELVVEQETKALENMLAEGVELHELTPEQIEQFREAVVPAIDNNINLIGEEMYNRALEELGN
ncbi:TRAP transporter substrate-binding protein [Alkalihalobacterium alkalinitrilicum]|uniref:TRAP transporter substrate-binding protein n=1 Tax=Alkalihalobacterium alkalinitrilicum TaxID=427920 RepID=UPI000995D666|nr:TRAP transporter substrate-binding protein [Alkalihalobacterium alkalinitrilicum]